MKLLLTSGGITNDTLARELEELAEKSLDELVIGFIPTAAFANEKPQGWLIRDLQRLLDRGAAVTIISLADLTSSEIERRLSNVDVICVGGGDTFYLSYMLQQKNMFKILPKLLETKTYVGISAGSMVVTATLKTTSKHILNVSLPDHDFEKDMIGEFSSANTVQLVSFALRPHFNERLIDEISGGVLQNIANSENVQIYAIDDNCAIRVVNDEIVVVGEGSSMVIEPNMTSQRDEL